MWHAIDLADVPIVKLYLNPRLGTRGPDADTGHVGAARTTRSVEQPLGGYRPRWGAVPRLGPQGIWFRIKIYLRHEHADQVPPKSHKWSRLKSPEML